MENVTVRLHCLKVEQYILNKIKCVYFRIYSTFTHLLSNNLRSHMRLDDVRLTHITHSEHQTRRTVAMTYHSIARKQQRLGSLFGTRQLGKYNAHHKCLDKNTCDTLQAYCENGLGAFLRYESVAISDRVLGFNRIQKC